MLLLVFVLALYATCISARIQGILLPYRRLTGAIVSDVTVEPAVSSPEQAARSCAKHTAAANAVKFEVWREIFYTQGREVLDSWQCSYSFQNFTQQMRQFQVMELGRSAICSPTENCGSIDHFHDLPAETTLNEEQHKPMSQFVDFTQAANPMTFDECKQLAINYNNALSVMGNDGPPVNYVKFFTVGEIWPRDSSASYYNCHGISEVGWSDYSRLERHVGLLTRPNVIRYSPIANIYEGTHLNNVACMQKDIPYEWYAGCTEFSYTNAQVPPRTSLPLFVDLSVPPSYTAVHSSSSNHSNSITYQKIAQDRHHIFPVSKRKDGHQIRIAQSSKIRAYTAQEAVRSCAAIAVAAGHNSFNLVLHDSGWTCVWWEAKTANAQALRSLDYNALQSYLYSAVDESAPIAEDLIVHDEVVTADEDSDEDRQPQIGNTRTRKVKRPKFLDSRSGPSIREKA